MPDDHLFVNAGCMNGDSEFIIDPHLLDCFDAPPTVHVELLGHDPVRRED